MTSLDITNCPVCGKNTFLKFLFKESNGFIDYNNGYCKRGKFCNYNSDSIDKKNRQKTFTFTIPDYAVEDAMINGYKKTNFAKYLSYHLKYEAWNLLNKYFVGNFFQSDNNENIFWRIDDNLVVRSGIYTLYDKEKGIRLKSASLEPIFDDEFRVVSFSSCFFGAHLINFFPQKDIAIVEDEKTAIVCSYFWPEFNWLATGNLNKLNWREYEVYNVLVNKNVILFFDNNIALRDYEILKSEWGEMAEYFSSEIRCNISVKSLFEDKINKLNNDKQKLILQLLVSPRN